MAGEWRRVISDLRFQISNPPALRFCAAGEEEEAEQDYGAAVMKVGGWIFRECMAGFGSIEDDGAVAAEEHAVLEHQAQGAGEHELFDVAASLNEILRCVRVIDGN